MTTRRWVDWVNIILGSWLVASPWLLAEAADDWPAAWSSVSAGIGIMALAFSALRKPALWGDALGILLGTWLIASPWVLEFSGAAAAVRNVVISGSLVIGYALWAVRIDLVSDDGVERDVRIRSA